MALFDDAVGEVVNALKEAGQLRDTLLVYTTDHGWSDKGFAYEGSSHVPLIAHWPRLRALSPGPPINPAAAAAAAAGEGRHASSVGQPSGALVLPQLCSTVDLAATFLAAGSRGTLPAQPRGMDGVSLLPVLLLGTDRGHHHREFTFVANGWGRAVVSRDGLKLMRNFFPRQLNRQWARESGGVRINPYFGPG